MPDGMTVHDQFTDTAETVLASYEKKRIIGLFVDYFFFFID